MSIFLLICLSWVVRVLYKVWIQISCHFYVYVLSVCCLPFNVLNGASWSVKVLNFKSTLWTFSFMIYGFVSYLKLSGVVISYLNHRLFRNMLIFKWEFSGCYFVIDFWYIQLGSENMIYMTLVLINLLRLVSWSTSWLMFHMHLKKMNILQCVGWCIL